MRISEHGLGPLTPRFTVEVRKLNHDSTENFLLNLWKSMEFVVKYLRLGTFIRTTLDPKSTLALLRYGRTKSLAPQGTANERVATHDLGTQQILQEES